MNRITELESIVAGYGLNISVCFGKTKGDSSAQCAISGVITLNPRLSEPRFQQAKSQKLRRLCPQMPIPPADIVEFMLLHEIGHYHYDHFRRRLQYVFAPNAPSLQAFQELAEYEGWSFAYREYRVRKKNASLFPWLNNYTACQFEGIRKRLQNMLDSMPQARSIEDESLIQELVESVRQNRVMPNISVTDLLAGVHR